MAITDGSITAAVSQSISSGTFTISFTGWAKRSDMEPPVCTPRTFRWSQQLVCPLLQG